jgi:hypothetical protein
MISLREPVSVLTAVNPAASKSKVNFGFVVGNYQPEHLFLGCASNVTLHRTDTAMCRMEDQAVACFDDRQEGSFMSNRIDRSWTVLSASKISSATGAAGYKRSPRPHLPDLGCGSMIAHLGGDARV